MNNLNIYGMNKKYFLNEKKDCNEFITNFLNALQIETKKK